MCLPASLWDEIARNPFNYTITARTLLPKCDDYQFQRLILQFPALGKNICRIASMFIITRAVSTPRDVERRERGSMFCETRCFSLDIRLFTYISSCSLSHSSRRLLSILVSSLTFLHVFLDSLYAFYFLLFSVALSLSFRLFSLKTPALSTNLKYNNLPLLTKL